MVEYTLNLDKVFGCLSDMTRRDILSRVARGQLTVGEIAEPYPMSLAAVSKHLQVLERANLIRKRKQGKEHIVHLAPTAFKEASEYLEYYRMYWESQFDALEEFLNRGEGNGRISS